VLNLRELVAFPAVLLRYSAKMQLSDCIQQSGFATWLTALAGDRGITTLCLKFAKFGGYHSSCPTSDAENF